MIFIRENDLAGAFLISIDMDDFNGSYCSQGEFPLLNSIKSSLKAPLNLARTSQAATFLHSNLNLKISLTILKFIVTLFKII
jgi:hypothetical protein